MEYLKNSQPPPGAFAQAYGQPQPQQQQPMQQYQNQQHQAPYQQQQQQQAAAQHHHHHQTSAPPMATSAYSSAPPPPQQLHAHPHPHHQQQQSVQHRPISLHAAPPGVPAPQQQQRRLSRNGSGGGKGSMASSKKAFGSLRALDFFGHLDEDFVVRSASGGMITAVAALVMVLLFFGELKYYLHGKPTTTLSVDATRSAALDISFDLTMHKLPCSWLTLDAMDVAGTSEVDVSHHVHKRRIDPTGHGFMPDDEGGVKKVAIGPANKPGLLPEHDGTPSCGSCYGAGLGPNEVPPSQLAAANNETATATGGAETTRKPDPPRCCATCDDVRAAYRLRGWKPPDPLTIKQCHDEEHREEVMQQRGEGCHIWGSLRVAKVAGSFHIAPGKSWNGPMGHSHDLSPFTGAEIDVSHTVNKLSFGPPYPGQHSPLDGAHYSSEASSAPGPAPSGAGAAAAMLAAMNGASPDDAAAAGAVAGADPATGRRAGAVQYFLKVVPTTHTQFVDAAFDQSSDGGNGGASGGSRKDDDEKRRTKKKEVTTWSSTFSVAEHVRSPAGDGFDPPGVFFFYDVSPLRVRHSVSRPSLASFLASACAVVGGVWSVAGAAEAALAAQRAARARKVELGKAH